MQFCNPFFKFAAEKYDLAAVREQGLGAYRAGRLSSKQRQALIKYYGLPEDDDLKKRNYWRGVAGQVGGGLAGVGAGFGLLKVLSDASIKRGGGPAYYAMPAIPIASLVGSALGNKLMTDRYSVERANEILRKNK